MNRQKIDFIIANSSGFIEACERIAKESYNKGYEDALKGDDISSEYELDLYEKMKKDFICKK